MKDVGKTAYTASQALAVIKEYSPSSPERGVACAALSMVMDSAVLETLRKTIYQGPMKPEEAGTKASVGVLVSWGLVAHIAVNGQQGFIATTDLGWEVYHSVRPVIHDWERINGL